MKKLSIIIFLTTALTATLPARSDSMATQPHSPREKLLQEYPIIQNDSIEQGKDYLFENALLYLQKGDTQKAYQSLHTCLQLDSTQAEVWFRLAPIYQMRKNKDSVQICLESAHRYDVHNKSYMLNLASFYSRDEKLTQAAQLLEKLVNDYPDEYEYYYAISALYGEASLPNEAIRILKQLEAIVGKNQDISLDVYNYYRRLGKEKKAIKEMEQLRKSDPDNLMYLMLLAYAYEEYKVEKAIKLYRQAMEDESEQSSDAAFLLADFLRRLERKQEAEELYQSLFSSHKGSFNHKMDALQNYYLKEHAQDSALIQSAFENILSQYPQQAQAHSLYAAWLKEQHQVMKAAIHYRQAIDLNPMELQNWTQYVNLFIESQNFGMIKDVCSEARAYFPQEFIFPYYIAVTNSIENNLPATIQAYQACLDILHSQAQAAQLSRVLGEMGDVYHRMNKMDSCYIYYNDALIFDANNAMVLNNYAYFLSEENRDLEQAEKMARQAVKLEANNATYLDTYAWVCFKQGNYTMAKIYIERALLNDDTQSAEIVEHYGDILWFCNDKAKALEQWKLAASMSAEVSEKLQQKINTASYVE